MYTSSIERYETGLPGTLESIKLVKIVLNLKFETFWSILLSEKIFRIFFCLTWKILSSYGILYVNFFYNVNFHKSIGFSMLNTKIFEKIFPLNRIDQKVSNFKFNTIFTCLIDSRVPESPVSYLSIGLVSMFALKHPK